MKIAKQIVYFIGIVALGGCEDELPQGERENTPPITAFTATPSSANPNYIILENTSQGAGIFSAWRFQEGRALQRDKTTGLDTAYYPEAGAYEITLLAGNDAGVDSTKQTITIAQRDPDLADPNIDAFRVLGDFENGQVGAWNAWSQDVTVVDNPAANAINGSSKVLRIAQNEAFQTAARNETAIIVPSAAIRLTTQAYFEMAGRLKLQIETPFETGYFIDVPAGEWVTIAYVFDDTGVGALPPDGDYPIVMFQGDTVQKYKYEENADNNFTRAGGYDE